MSLATEEVDSEQTEQQSLQQQLEKTNELVNTLTKQLAYMKESVRLKPNNLCWLIYFLFFFDHLHEDGRATKETTTQSTSYTTPQQTNTHAICWLLIYIL